MTALTFFVRKNVRNSLLINVDHGNEDMEFYDAAGSLLAKGYTRVVIGKRGPYVEFERRHVRWEVFCVPPAEKFRLYNNVVFYNEYRSRDASWVKLYLQKRTVAYADYKVGLCYISPSDLRRLDDQPVIVSP